MKVSENHAAGWIVNYFYNKKLDELIDMIASGKTSVEEAINDIERFELDEEGIVLGKGGYKVLSRLTP